MLQNIFVKYRKRYFIVDQHLSICKRWSKNAQVNVHQPTQTRVHAAYNMYMQERAHTHTHKQTRGNKHTQRSTCTSSVLGQKHLTFTPKLCVCEETLFVFASFCFIKVKTYVAQARNRKSCD